MQDFYRGDKKSNSQMQDFYRGDKNANSQMQGFYRDDKKSNSQIQDRCRNYSNNESPNVKCLVTITQNKTQHSLMFWWFYQLFLPLTQAACWSQPSVLIDHGYWIANRVLKSPPCVACKGCDTGCEPFFRGLALYDWPATTMERCSTNPACSWWQLSGPPTCMGGVCTRLGVAWCCFRRVRHVPIDQTKCKYLQLSVYNIVMLLYVWME